MWTHCHVIADVVATSVVTIANGQCYNCSEKGYYARNCPKPRVRDSKYFIKHMLLAKQDEAGVNLTDEQNDFIFADASQMEEIKELSANICLMAKIQPVNIDSEVGPSYISTFLKIKEMKDVFDSSKRDLSETWKQNEILKDQLLEATLKHEIECCVLLSHECVDNKMQDEIEKLQKGSIEIQEGMQKRINILENDGQRCQKQSLDFELQLQHEKERRKCESSLKNVCETFWISKMEKLKNENMSLTDQVQSLIQERENTLSNKQQDVGMNENIIAPGMYKVRTSQVANTNKAKSVLSSTGLGATFSVRISLDRDSSFKDSVISNSKNSVEKVEVFDRTNKKPDVASKNVTLNNFVSNDEIKNALIMKNALYVTCDNNVLAPCHDNFLKKYKLSVRLNIRRALFTTPRTVKSRFKDTTHVLRLAITGYGDYVHDNITICHVYYIQGLRHNLVSVGEFYDGDLESAFCSQTCYMQILEGDDLLTRARKSNLYTISISDMVASSPEVLWVEAVSTACFTQNQSIIHKRHTKTPYELLRDRKPDVEYFHVFGSLCCPTNDRDDLGKIKPKADIGEEEKGMMNSSLARIVYMLKMFGLSLPQDCTYCVITSITHNFERLAFAAICQKWGCYKKPGHLAVKLGCAKMKVVTWDDVAFKTHYSWVKHDA
nr:retrovirus-related Pol polyprotein from transposon TNT 1-94 [Tanacetum cinerariifolium]